MFINRTTTDHFELNTKILDYIFRETDYKPLSVIKTGSMVFADKEYAKNTDLDLVVITGNIGYKNFYRKIIFGADENEIGMSVINPDDFNRRISNIDIDSLERVSTMTMPASCLYDTGFAAGVNQQYTHYLFDYFRKFTAECLLYDKVEDKVTVKADLKEFIMFPFALDLYRVPTIQENVGRFLGSKFHDYYVAEISNYLKNTLPSNIMKPKDEYLSLDIRQKDYIRDDSSTKERLRPGIPYLAAIEPIEPLNTAGINKEIMDRQEAATKDNSPWYEFLKDMNLLDIKHFDKENGCYVFYSGIGELCLTGEY